MLLTELNQLDTVERLEKLLLCCGSAYWARQLNDAFPFNSMDALIQKSDEIWSEAQQSDILEAFQHHPKIGDIQSLAAKFASTKDWAGNEQSGVNLASQEVLKALAQGNADYEKKFGYIFIVCATGKSANEMLELLLQRLPHHAEQELKIAAAEQNKITQIRLNKLVA
jgi:2-oxo-4-hydroxy-4-carboxy-5-ureidoimidazoline decarboxylase